MRLKVIQDQQNGESMIRDRIETAATCFDDFYLLVFTNFHEIYSYASVGDFYSYASWTIQIASAISLGQGRKDGVFSWCAFSYQMQYCQYNHASGSVFLHVRIGAAVKRFVE